MDIIAIGKDKFEQKYTVLYSGANSDATNRVLSESELSAEANDTTIKYIKINYDCYALIFVTAYQANNLFEDSRGQTFTFAYVFDRKMALELFEDIRLIGCLPYCKKSSDIEKYKEYEQITSWKQFKRKSQSCMKDVKPDRGVTNYMLLGIFENAQMIYSYAQEVDIEEALEWLYQGYECLPEEIRISLEFNTNVKSAQEALKSMSLNFMSNKIFRQIQGTGFDNMSISHNVYQRDKDNLQSIHKEAKEFVFKYNEIINTDVRLIEEIAKDAKGDLEKFKEEIVRCKCTKQKGKQNTRVKKKLRNEEVEQNMKEEYRSRVLINVSLLLIQLVVFGMISLIELKFVHYIRKGSNITFTMDAGFMTTVIAFGLGIIFMGICFSIYNISSKRR